jgi:hypothetical protein
MTMFLVSTAQEQRRPSVIKEAIGLMKQIHQHVVEEDSKRHQKYCCCRKIISALRETTPQEPSVFQNPNQPEPRADLEYDNRKYKTQ